MALDGESQVKLEAVRPKTIISTRTTTDMGTWNVQNMHETGKTTTMAAEIRTTTPS
ncbi:hypothetical protein DPMN_100016 [Dreissena polymorpha]|uniref:Uncharacterized protein n=1 Tax=Dreissena polymorpha TaxID=45954 RepID=A0A9D4LGL7_DREPO|nr:hypothetical protein DPMN_100016 [Dreissena polymorpha]